MISLADACFQASKDLGRPLTIVLMTPQHIEVKIPNVGMIDSIEIGCSSRERAGKTCKRMQVRRYTTSPEIYNIYSASYLQHTHSPLKYMCDLTYVDGEKCS